MQKQECDGYTITMELSEVLNKAKYLKFLGSIFNHSENTTLKFLVAAFIIVQASYDGANEQIFELMEDGRFFLLLLRPVVLRASVLRLKASSSQAPLVTHSCSVWT